MRIALLSTLDGSPEVRSPRPAFASFAGAMVVERQLDLAVKLGCDRVVCLVDAIEREVVELQNRAESAGVKFRAIRHPSRLLGMVTAEDEILVIAPGILPDDEAAIEALEKRAVLAFPADLAVPLGFERIDLELAWSGIMLVRGELIARLGQLPDDIDVPSAVMRIALQGGSRLIALDRALLAEGNWHLNADRQALDEREKRWIDSQRKAISFRGPGLAIAERAGARLARDVVGQSAQPVPTAAAGISAVAGLGAGAFGFPAIGLVLTALAALFGHMGGVVERVAQLGRPERRPNKVLRALDWLIDPILVVLLVLAAPEDLGLLRGFVPIMLIGLLRLSERHASRKWRETYADRILLCFLLSPAAFAGFSTEMAAALALLVLLSRFFPTFRDD